MPQSLQLCTDQSWVHQIMSDSTLWTFQPPVCAGFHTEGGALGFPPPETWTLWCHDCLNSYNKEHNYRLNVLWLNLMFPVLKCIQNFIKSSGCTNVRMPPLDTSKSPLLPGKNSVWNLAVWVAILQGRGLPCPPDIIAHEETHTLKATQYQRWQRWNIRSDNSFVTIWEIAWGYLQ